MASRVGGACVCTFCSGVLCAIFVYSLIFTRRCDAFPNTLNIKQHEAHTHGLGTFCIFLKQGIRCYSTPVGSPLSLPTFLGIGPAKSGSTSLFDTLGQHPQVAVANATLGGRGCCGPEIGLLLKDSSLGTGTVDYAQYFDQNLKGIKASGEKVPHYASITTVPYAARALLGGGLKLLYTWRDSLELDASLYLHRHAHQSVPNQTYAEWSAARLQAHDKWYQCRQAQLQLVFSGSGLHSPDNFPERQVDGFVEATIHRQCGQGEHKGDSFQEILHPLNLRRWVSVFGEEQLLCIHMLDQMYKPDATLRLISNFLNLQPFAQVTSKPRRSNTMERLEVLQRGMFGEKEIAFMRRALREVNASVAKFTSEKDWRWFREVCPRITS